MKTNAYGVTPYEGSSSHQIRSVRWDLLIAIGVDLAIWGVLIAAGVGLVRLFS